MFLFFFKWQTERIAFACGASSIKQWQQSEKNMGKEKRAQASCLFTIQRQCDVSAERRMNSLIPMSKHLALDRWSATTCGMCVKRTKSATWKFSYIDLSRTKWVKFHFISYIHLSRSLSDFQFDIEWFFPSNISIILFVFWHQFQTVFILNAFTRIYQNSAVFTFFFYFQQNKIY